MLSSPFGVPVGTSPENVKSELRAEIERRLRNACTEWSEADFQTLVDDATRIAIKYIPPTGPPSKKRN
jgi:hypothetical protein